MSDTMKAMAHFPKLLRELPPFDGPFDAFKLEAKDCDVLFASYPAGTVIAPHSHDTDNVGVITQGELILTLDGEETRYRAGEWYQVRAKATHAARFEVETSEIEFWFHAPPARGVLIRKSMQADFAAMLAIVNDGAQAYRGVIPADRWHEPYMPAHELAKEIAAGIVFWVAEEQGRILGVMGMQDKGDVALVRHAYVATATQRSGVGTKLLRHVQGLTHQPVLIGTWAAAAWAVDFYRRNGFTVVSESEKNRLLRKYWSIPVRQIETSVVLADARWTKEG
jgi:N-acetylglutamate synthase-like GNAT family acetyltransferase/quercetin dioxygenase-like cupin family protein